MHHEGAEDPIRRASAVGAFVRKFTFSAPAELALRAGMHPQACLSFKGARSLVEHLLEAAHLPEEMRLAWSIALLEGDALRRALQEFADHMGRDIRRYLKAAFGDEEDAWQELLLAILERPEFRKKVFGSFAGEGKLASYLRKTFLRESMRLKKDAACPSFSPDLLDETPQQRETAPHEMEQEGGSREKLRTVLRELSDDPGLLPFLLQHGFELTAAQIGEILGISNSAVRQRTFRFRKRFKERWDQGTSKDSIPKQQPGTHEDDGEGSFR